MDLQLGGKTALVLGASKGLGRAIADSLSGRSRKRNTHSRRSR
jgi:NAD(P)-dependent dehydrogenase (short-subunit alcohol dehydrogenase family)